MIKVVGVRFKSAGKVYDFNAGAFVLNQGDPVIVETEQGLGFGFVAVPPESREENSSDRPLKKVFRMAGEKDFEQRINNIELEKKVFLSFIIHGVLRTECQQQKSYQ